MIVNAGPACVRTKDKRNAAIDLLREHGLAEVIEGRVIALVSEASGISA